MNEIMQFKLTLLLLFIMVIFIQSLHGQKCNCIGCTDKVSVNPNNKYQIYSSVPCSDGKTAVISKLNVESTDGSMFTISTKDDPSDTAQYTFASTASAVTCFKMIDGLVVGGNTSKIYVIISCNNWLQPCPLRYSISLACAPVKTTSTSIPTSASTGKPVNPSTPKLTSTSTFKPVYPPTSGSDTCVCRCCQNGYSSITVGGSTILDVQRCVPSKYPGTAIKISTTCRTDLCRQSCIDQVPNCADAVTLIPGSKTYYKVELMTTCRGHSLMVTHVIFVLLSIFVSSTVLRKN